MSEFTVNEELTKTIISKRAQSIPLTTAEENYSRQLFNHLMDNKKSMHKTIQIVTGTDLRKGALDVPPLRKDPNIKVPTKEFPGDNPNAQPDESLREGKKLPDVDGKPATIYTEDQRIADSYQVDVERRENVDQPQPSPTPKYTNKIKVGDMVTKTVGENTLKGQVLAIDGSAHAIVKWDNGRQTPEYVVKLEKAERKVTPPDMTYEVPVKKEASADPKVHKGDPSHTEVYEAVKDKPGVEDPHALAQHIVEEAGGEPKKSDGETDVRKDGDILPEASAVPGPYGYTPFQELVCSLERMVAVAGEVKAARDRVAHDYEVAAYYDNIIDSLRRIVEDLLAAMSMELKESKTTAEIE